MHRNTLLETILILIRELEHKSDNELLIMAKIEGLLEQLREEE